jgi:hypothetical protein
MLRLERLAEAAIAAVERALNQGDVKTSIAVLRGLGLLSGSPPSLGSDDAEELARNREREQRQTEFSEMFSLI